MKKFAVIGLGNFGYTVARELSRMDCRVTAIDSNREKVEKLANDVYLAIVSDATDRDFIENLGVDDYDCFVVSTGKDNEASILITLYLKEMGAKEIVVKALTEDHEKILQKLGATETIIPEKRMAERISRSLALSNVIDYIPLSDEFKVAELVPPDDFVGKRLKDLQLRNNYHLQVIAVRKGTDQEIMLAPGGEYLVAQGDILILLGKISDINQLS